MADPGPGPRLAVVGDPAARGDGDRGEPPPTYESATTAPGSRPAGRTRTLVWLAALALLGFLLAYEVRYAGQLEVRVEELSVELGEAREALGVYQRRMARVGRDLDELASRLGALRELVKQDPLPTSGSEPRAGED